MRTILLFSFGLMLAFTCHCQVKLAKSSVSSMGSSYRANGGYSINQTIAQPTSISKHSVSGITLSQGFQFQYRVGATWGNAPLQVYPNPSTGKISISFAEWELNYPLEIKVTDINGRNIYSSLLGKNSAPHEFNFSNIPKGAYLIGITGEGGYFASCIIILI